MSSDLLGKGSLACGKWTSLHACIYLVPGVVVKVASVSTHLFFKTGLQGRLYYLYFRDKEIKPRAVAHMPKATLLVRVGSGT